MARREWDGNSAHFHLVVAAVVVAAAAGHLVLLLAVVLATLVEVFAVVVAVAELHSLLSYALPPLLPLTLSIHFRPHSVESRRHHLHSLPLHRYCSHQHLCHLSLPRTIHPPHPLDPPAAAALMCSPLVRLRVRLDST